MITKEEAQQLILTKRSMFNHIENYNQKGLKLLHLLQPSFPPSEANDKEADLVDLKPTINYIVNISMQSAHVSEADEILNDLDNLRGCLGQQNFYTIIGSTLALFNNVDEATKFLIHFVTEKNGINYYYENLSYENEIKVSPNENIVALANSEFQEIFLKSLYNFCENNPSIMLNSASKSSQDVDSSNNNNNQNILEKSSPVFSANIIQKNTSISANVNMPKSPLNNNNQNSLLNTARQNTPAKVNASPSKFQMNSNQITLHDSFENNNRNSDEPIINYSGMQPFDGIIPPPRNESEASHTSFFASGANELKSKFVNFKTEILQFLIDRKAERHNREEERYQNDNVYQL